MWKKRGQPKAFSQDHFVKKRKDLSEQEKKAIIKKLEGRKTPQLTPEIETIILGQSKREGTLSIAVKMGILCQILKPTQRKFSSNSTNRVLSFATLILHCSKILFALV